MENLTHYIFDQALILIPVLYVVAEILKGTKIICDEFIPVAITVVGIGLAFALMGFSTESLIQGILVSGATVYSNQLFVQGKKKKEIVEQMEQIKK